MGRLADLAEPWQGETFRADVRALRSIVQGREDTLRAALDADPMGWTGALREPPCFVERGTIATTFATTWGTLDQTPWTTGAMTMALTWDGEAVPVTPAGAVAGAQGETAILAAGASTADGGTFVTSAIACAIRNDSASLPAGSRSIARLSSRLATIASRSALPVRSPYPLIVPWTCVTPASTAAIVFATAQPASL